MMKTSPPPSEISDAAPRNWVIRCLPDSLQPYAQLMRLDRPIGWWLLVLPCWWGLALAQISVGGGQFNLWLAGLFLAGAIVMRGAGCTLNDIADRDFDAKVERTKNRPIASGRVSVRGAVAFLVVLFALGFLILLQFNRFTVMAGAVSTILIALYPFMKRITYYPQFVLGLAFNWGALLGWTALQGSLSWAPVLLYAGGVLWTLAYDTIYAHQDKDDDVLIGVKSTALKFGDATPNYLVGFFGGALVLFGLAFAQTGVSPLAYLGLLAAALHAGWQVQHFDGNDSAQCLKLFKANRGFGLLVLCGLLLELIFT
jgi:4-hydroxybenzoate polyprenyltransferase